MATTRKSSKSSTPTPAEAAAAKPGFRGTFTLLPPTAESFKCEGTGQGEKPHKVGAVLPRKSFPTTTGPERRTAECRSCRNYRQGRAEKQAAKVLEQAKAKSAAKRTSSTQASAKAQASASRTPRAAAKRAAKVAAA